MSIGSSTWFIAIRTTINAFFFTLFWVGGLVLAHQLDGGLRLPGWTAVAGWIAAIAGGALCLACVTVFTIRGRGTPAPFDSPRVFVVVGPYRYCRNPMLLGFCVMLAGLGLILRSPAGLGFAAFAALCGHLMVVLWEERHLARKFGQPYLDYRASVPRWFPSF